MESSFKEFEQRLERLYGSLPGAGRRESRLTRLYFYVFKLLQERFNVSLADAGLTTTTFNALLLLYTHSEAPVSPSVLSQVMMASRTNITRVADELEEKGWLRRCPHPADRHRVGLVLTAAGRAKVERVLPRQRCQLGELWAGLTVTEQAQFENLLSKLHERLHPEDPGRGDPA